MTIEERLAELVSTADGRAAIREAAMTLSSGGHVRDAAGWPLAWSDVVLALLVRIEELEDVYADVCKEIDAEESDGGE